MDLSASMQATKDLFLFPFRDKNWKNKLLIGVGMTLASMAIPIIPWFFTAGYGARLMRAGAANSTSEDLPEWDDWGDLMLDGLRLLGAGLLVSLPGIILMGGGWLFYMVGVINFSSTGEHASSGDAWMMIFSMMVMFFTMGLGMVLWMAALVVSPPAMAHIAVQRRFSALFDIKGWGRILRVNFSGFVLAVMLFFAVYWVMMLAFQILYFTIILCFLAPLLIMPIAFYCGVVYQRLIGQAYGDALRKLETPQSEAVVDAAAGDGAAQPV